ncbi:AMP-binding protein [Kitasatospora indigofera]|uniref:class I adenylate-forming enzyme family protein n=1 Tax=Kitasatospora indigofera TaxID=67307 RepID=UPI00369BFE0E
MVQTISEPGRSAPHAVRLPAPGRSSAATGPPGASHERAGGTAGPRPAAGTPDQPSTGRRTVTTPGVVIDPAQNPLTLPDLLDHRAGTHPERVALLVRGGGSVTYGQWRASAVRAAHGLARSGVRPGDRVALLFTNQEWERYAVAFMAVQYAGAVALAVREDHSATDTARLVELAGARTAVRGTARPAVPGLADLLLDHLTDATGAAGGPAGTNVPDEPPHRPAPEDPAQIIGTSGTTGAPKGVLAAHASLTAGLALNPRPRPYAHSGHALHAFPIGTNAAQVVLVGALTGHPTTVCLPRFDAEEFARTVAELAVGTVFLVPSMAVELVNSKVAERHDLTGVLLVSCSAAALPAPVATALAGALPKATVVNTYTSAEASPAQISTIVDATRPGSVGRPADPDGLRILDPDGHPVPPGGTGDIWLRQPGPPRRYIGAGAPGGAVFQDGWVRMGDLGRLDADGHLYLVDRESDIIKSGALKVSTLRIEEVLHEHPRVADAAALGVPHPVMGSVPVAVVVPAAGGLDLDDLRLFLAARLGRPELPVRILLADTLPRNPSGKVVKHLLRARFDTPRAAPAAGPAPGTPTELALAALWRRVLGRPVRSVEEEFFAAGGDSFRAVQLAAAISAGFGAAAGTALVFERPSLRAQAAWLDTPGRRAGTAAGGEAAGSTEAAGSGTAEPATGPATEVSPFLAELRAQAHDLPLTSQQENFLRWSAEAPGRDAGTVTVQFRVTGALRPDLLGRAVLEVVRRHPALRTSFEPVAGRPGVVRAVLHPEPRADITLVDLDGADDALVNARLIAERDRLTDLANEPLTRLLVVSRGPADHVVMLGVHHMVSDGWSLGVVLQDLGVAYSALRRERPVPAPRPGTGYRDLVEDANARWPASRAHFARALAGAPAALDPFPGRRPAWTLLTGAQEFTVPAARTAALRERAAELGATPFLAVAAAWSAVLAEHGGRSDLVLMTPVPGRTTPESERTVGCFVQSLLLRVDTSGAPGHAELIDRLRRTYSAALDHQLYPFAEFSPQAPFAAWIRYEAWNAPAQLPGLPCAPWDLPRSNTVPLPMPDGDLHVPELMAAEQPDGSLRCWLRHNTHAFDAGTIDTLRTAFEAGLAAMTGG